MNNGAVTIVYDGDGNRVAKTANGVTTHYLVDDLNPTGYAQVVDEVLGTVASRTYTYGPQRISEGQAISGVWTPSFYGYDGAGAVRYLANAVGTVTDTYDYDAWGNEVNSTGSTPNVYLYRGEQWDPDLGLYYLRARYFSPGTGRLLAGDPDPGHARVPATLHKYTYASDDPVDGRDPSGKDTLLEYTLLLRTSPHPPLPSLAFPVLGLAFAPQGRRKAGGCDYPAVFSQGPAFIPDLWNESKYVRSNNCYTYAEDIRYSNPDFTQPGSKFGEPITGPPFTCTQIEFAAALDGLKTGCRGSRCPTGYHSVMLFIGTDVREPGPRKSLGADYHWYRQDSNGLWSSKHGEGAVQNMQVTDPANDARTWGYRTQCPATCARNQ